MGNGDVLFGGGYWIESSMAISDVGFQEGYKIRKVFGYKPTFYSKEIIQFWLLAFNFLHQQSFESFLFCFAFIEKYELP